MSKKAILVHPLIILLSLLFVLFIIGRSSSKLFGDSDITKPLLKRKSLLRAILLLSKDEFDIRNYINIECLIVSKKLFSSQKSYLKGTIKEKELHRFCNSFSFIVDQPGLIHGISLSLLAKYLPFVLIVCVAEM